MILDKYVCIPKIAILKCLRDTQSSLKIYKYRIPTHLKDHTNSVSVIYYFEMYYKYFSIKYFCQSYLTCYIRFILTILVSDGHLF